MDVTLPEAAANSYPGAGLLACVTATNKVELNKLRCIYIYTVHSGMIRASNQHSVFFTQLVPHDAPYCSYYYSITLRW